MPLRFVPCMLLICYNLRGCWISATRVLRRFDEFPVMNNSLKICLGREIQHNKRIDRLPKTYHICLRSIWKLSSRNIVTEIQVRTELSTKVEKWRVQQSDSIQKFWHNSTYQSLYVKSSPIPLPFYPFTNSWGANYSRKATNDCELLYLPDNSIHENNNLYESQTIGYR